jgi:hypothetical protein
MESHKGISGIAILNKQKCHFSFSFARLENKRAEQVLSGGADTSWRREDVGKWCRRVNMMQILCTCKCKQKKDTS